VEVADVVWREKYGKTELRLHGDKEGLSSVRVNDQYRIEFREITEGNKTIAQMVSITELSNHYK
jgi:proteic killer suppression protein